MASNRYTFWTDAKGLATLIDDLRPSRKEGLLFCGEFLNIEVFPHRPGQFHISLDKHQSAVVERLAAKAAVQDRYAVKEPDRRGS